MLRISFDYTLDGDVPRDNGYFNNIFSTIGAYLYAESTTASDQQFFSDYALYETNCIFNYTNFGDGDNSGNLDSLTPTIWDVTYNQDKESVYADPEYVDTVTNDFHLEVTSP